jgi:hypothetical protein
MSQPLSDQEIEAYIQQKIALLPEWLQRIVRWLHRPEARVVRWVAGIAFICGGLLWFLPVLGLWMLPLGLILIAEDIPPLKRWLVRVSIALEERWHRWRNRR